MFKFANIKRDKEKVNLIEFITFAVFISILLVLAYVFGRWPIKKGELGDSDCYMHLIRASDLYHTGRWYDPVILRSNAPYGERLLWTRPFDILLLLGAVPIALFTDFESALFWWGVVISPILLIATLIAFQWSTRPILSKDGTFLAGFMFFLQLIIIAYYQPGRPDHHSLLISLFVLSIGFTLRIILRPFSARLCYIAGAITALSLWVSVESMLLICTILGVLGLLWVLENGDFASKNLHYTLSLFVVTGLNIIFQRPWHDLTTREFASLSIVHWSVLGFITLLWIVISVFDRHTRVFRLRVNRFSFGLAGVATLALTIWLCFPKFYKGPFVNVHPRLFPIFLDKVAELQPLLSRHGLLCLPVQVIGTAIVGFAFIVYLLFWSGHNENRKAWIYIALSLVAFLLISLYQIRWSAYTQALSIIPVTALMFSVLVRVQSRIARFLIVTVFWSTFLVLGLSADMVFKRGASARPPQKTSLIQICRYLNETDKWRERNLRILTHLTFGAEILYRTRHEIIGAVYAAPGILDTYDIMTADTDDKALEIIRKRKIDVILLCPKFESAFYSRPGQISTFTQRLFQNKAPNWLQRVELPSDLTCSFLLFEVIGN